MIRAILAIALAAIIAWIIVYFPTKNIAKRQSVPDVAYCKAVGKPWFVTCSEVDRYEYI